MVRTIFDVVKDQEEDEQGERNRTIFDVAKDEIESEQQEQEQGLWAQIKDKVSPYLPSLPEGLERLPEYEKSISKGLGEGFQRAGRAFGPLSPEMATENPQEQFSEQLEEQIPTEDENFAQRSIRRGLKEAPTAALAAPAAPLAILPRAMLAGFMGEGAKDLGLPEWAQTAAEITAFVGPDITKKLLSSGSNKELIEEARKFGLTDEQITPLIQSEFKQKWLSKLSPKRGRTQTALKSTKERLSEAYGTLQKSETAAQSLSSEASQEFTKASKKILEEVPSGVRETIAKDYKDLLKKPMTGDTLINFWGDVNHAMGGNTKQLSLLKKPIKDALQKISPELAQDFEMINKLHSKYYEIAGKLKPTLTSDIVSAAETIGLFGSAVTGYYPTLVSMLTEKGARLLSREMLLNPRLQQIAKKTIESINQNKWATVSKLMDLYKNEVTKFNPEIGSQFPEMNEKELKSFFNPQKSKDLE